MTPSFRTFAVAAVVLAVTLTGCSRGAESSQVELKLTPHAAPAALATVDPAGMRVPFQLDEHVMVDPGWDIAPQELDGVFIAPREQGDRLEFVAVDASGAVLWIADRPLTCTGYALTTTSDGRALAVLTDTPANSAPTDSTLAATTATAYDVHTGEQVWGPIDVPGPHLGPGLVFGALPQAAIGAVGPRTALNPTSGEATIIGGEPDGVIVGEYDGTVLVAQADDLVARTSADGEELWRVEASKLDGHPGDLKAAVGVRPGPGFAFLTDRDGAGILLDLEDGTIIASDLLDAATDDSAGVHVLVSDTEVYGQDAEGKVLWTHPAGDQTTITGIGGILVYLQSGDSLRVHNALTGDVALGYPPDQEGRIAVPTLLTKDGAGVVMDESRYYIATRPTE